MNRSDWICLSAFWNSASLKAGTWAFLSPVFPGDALFGIHHENANVPLPNHERLAAGDGFLTVNLLSHGKRVWTRLYTATCQRDSVAFGSLITPLSPKIFQSCRTDQCNGK